MEKQSNWYNWRYGKKEEVKQETNEAVRKLADTIAAIKSQASKEDEREQKIQVSDVAGALAFLYEKLRTIVDNKEERLLRKYAIERILKRRLLIEGTSKNIGLALIQELIHAHYLSNKAVPEKKVEEVQSIINKYIYLKDRVMALDKKKGGKDMEKWLVGLMACEIEVKLREENYEQAMVEFMYSVVKDDLLFPKNMDENEKKLQILIAAQRVLAKADRMISNYFIFRLYYPEWPRAGEKLIDEVAANLSLLRETIDKQMYHPMQEKIFIILQKEVIIYNILAETILANPGEGREIISDPERLANEVKKICAKRHKQAKGKLGRAAFRSIVYIFATKMVLAIGIEVPIDRYILQEGINWLAIVVNVVFPPLYMFFLALSIRMPLAKNTDKITAGIKGLVYTDAKRTTYKIKPPARSLVKQFVFSSVYSVITAAIFFGIITGLLRLRFNAVSIVIFLVFLSLVSFFGMIIRRSSHELIIYRQKEAVLTSVVDFFFLPIINMGRWLSFKFSQINVFIFFFDFIVEAPLKIFIQFLEEWFSFLKEKKEEIY